MSDEKLRAAMRLKELDDLFLGGRMSYGEKQEREALRKFFQDEERNETQREVPGARSASVNTKSRRPTFREAMSRAAKQVSLDGFTQIAGKSVVMGADYQLAKTLCMVMAEVYMAEPSYVVYCCGVQMPAEQVQAVYSELTGDHIEYLIRKIKQSRGKAVKYQRPYLRTMLYNAVFELEAQTQAGMDADLWEI